MKLKNSIAFIASLSLALLPLGAVASSSFVTGSSGNIWKTTATSTSTWSAETDPNGPLMQFEDSGSLSGTFDIVIVAETGAATPVSIDFSGGACGLAIPFSAVGSETVVVTTHQKSASQITCRVTYSSWISGMGRGFALQVDETDPISANSSGYGEFRFGIVSRPNNSPVQPMNPVSQVPSNPVKYSGPELSGLSAKGIMAGSASRLEGKNLDEISSITIDGKPAIFKLDGDKALDLTLPEGLAPGRYDLVINSSAGKLTHINAIRVREQLRSFSITSRSVGKISEEQYQEHALISAMQVPELNKARCVVNASSLAMAKAQAQRLCALVKAANPNIETTVVEARSTVKSDAVFARVSYGWNN